MPEQTISLRDLRHHVAALERLVTDAFASSDAVATLDFLKVRAAAKAILDTVPAPAPVALDARKLVTPKPVPVAKLAVPSAPAQKVVVKPVAPVPSITDCFPSLLNIRISS